MVMKPYAYKHNLDCQLARWRAANKVSSGFAGGKKDCWIVDDLDQFGKVGFHEAGDEFLDGKAEEQRKLAFDIEEEIDFRAVAEHRPFEHDLQMHGVAEPVADEIEQLILTAGKHALRMHRMEWNQRF